MKLSEERKAWLREQLADKSECHLFNFGNDGFDVHADLVSLLAENVALRRQVEKRFLFNDVFMERFHTYSGHERGCTYDQLDKGDICTCGLQGLITMYYEIRDALLADTQASR